MIYVGDRVQLDNLDITGTVVQVVLDAAIGTQGVHISNKIRVQWDHDGPNDPILTYDPSNLTKIVSSKTSSDGVIEA